ncbi:MAG: hypothetical protein VYA60_04635 [Pseudomonadota bacterium]|nr:hypothetical protein [Pseudomonadota bacterium]
MLSIAIASLRDADPLLSKKRDHSPSYFHEVNDSFHEVNDSFHEVNESFYESNVLAYEVKEKRTRPISNKNLLSSNLLSWHASTSANALPCTHDIINVIKGVFYVIKESIHVIKGVIYDVKENTMRSMKEWGDVTRGFNVAMSMRVNPG